MIKKQKPDLKICREGGSKEALHVMVMCIEDHNRKRLGLLFGFACVGTLGSCFWMFIAIMIYITSTIRC